MWQGGEAQGTLPSCPWLCPGRPAPHSALLQAWRRVGPGSGVTEMWLLAPTAEGERGDSGNRAGELSEPRRTITQAAASPSHSCKTASAASAGRRFLKTG